MTLQMNQFKTKTLMILSSLHITKVKVDMTLKAHLQAQSVELIMIQFS